VNLPAEEIGIRLLAEAADHFRNLYDSSAELLP